MDILDNSLIGGKREARKGRRAGGQDDAAPSASGGGRPASGAFMGSGPEEELTIAADSGIEHGDGMDQPPSRPSRRKGGWGEEASNPPSAKGARSNFFGGDAFDSDGPIAMTDNYDQRLTRRGEHRIGFDDDDDDGDIPVIPNLDEVQEEDLTQKVAQAPQIQVNKVATFRELDHDLLKHSAFTSLDNEIDLKLLAKVLSPESEIQEPDVAWDWNHLFTEVTSELQTEWDKVEGRTGDDAESGTLGTVS